MRQLFANNAAAVLDALLTDSATSFTATDLPPAYAFAYLPGTDETQFQMATITNKSEAPGVVEIIKITQHNGLDFDVIERAQEGTDAVEWAAGSTVAARVTAGMLQSFVQNQDGPGNALAIAGSSRIATTGGSSGVAINAAGNGVADGWLIGGFPVLQRTEDISSSAMDRLMAPEGYGGSMVVDLGAVPAWATATGYSDGDVVHPTTPDGFQYLLRMTAPVDGPLTSGTEPSWPGADASVPFESGDTFNFWHGIDLATGLILAVPPSGVKFYPTEVGFICFERTASTDPVVTIGTLSDQDRYANAQALTAIDGSNYIHRIPVTHGEGVTDLFFKLDTAATGGVVRGRFYYKGLFVQGN